MSAQTPIERAVDSIVRHAMKWHYWQTCPGEFDLKQGEVSKAARKLFNACERLKKVKRHNPRPKK